MPGCVGAQESPVTPDLHRVSGEGDLDLAASIGVADAVVGAGEAHFAVVPDLPDHDPIRGRPLRRRGEGLALHTVVLLREVSACMCRDEHAVVEDLDESLARCAELGGKVVVPTRSMGEARYCVIQDPAGAVAALYQA